MLTIDTETDRWNWSNGGIRTLLVDRYYYPLQMIYYSNDVKISIPMNS